MNTKQHSIGRERAIEFGKSGWWKGRTPREICEFQLFTQELAMNFGDFHEALEKCLGRPVWTHELALNFDGIVAEFLGQQQAPTMEDILNLIPKEKLMVIVSTPPPAEAAP